MVGKRLDGEVLFENARDGFVRKDLGSTDSPPGGFPDNADMAMTRSGGRDDDCSRYCICDRIELRVMRLQSLEQVNRAETVAASRLGRNRFAQGNARYFIDGPCASQIAVFRQGNVTGVV